MPRRWWIALLGAVVVLGFLHVTRYELLDRDCYISCPAFDRWMHRMVMIGPDGPRSRRATLRLGGSDTALRERFRRYGAPGEEPRPRNSAAVTDF